MSTLGTDAYCVTCGEDVENPIDGRCPKCSRTVIGRGRPPSASTNHQRPTIGQALAALIADLQRELESQAQMRVRAGEAMTMGKAVLVHLQRAADVAAGKKLTAKSPKTHSRGMPPGRTTCSECDAAILGFGKTGLCRSCWAKRSQRERARAAS